MDTTVITGGTLVLPDRMTRADLVIRAGTIVGVTTDASLIAADRAIDATNLLVLPGGVDVHTHAYDPDPQGREGFDTLTRAAAAGGVTTVVEMPMSEPAATNGAAFRARIELIGEKAVIDVAMYGAAIAGQPAEALDELCDAGALALKAFMCGGSGVMPPVSDAELARALEVAKRYGMLLTVHAENDSLLGAGVARMQAAGRHDPLAHAASRPPMVEAEAVRRAIFLAAQIGAHVHIAHVSCALAVEAVREARNRGVQVTAETCPQYLLLNEDDLARLGPWALCAPPLRPSADVDAVWEGLRDGTLDLVCSDHCGFTVEDKRPGETDIFAAPMGIGVIQQMLPAVFDEAVNRRGWTWPEIVARTSTAPARIFGLTPRKGTLTVGGDADVVLYAPDETWSVRLEDLLHRNKWSPFTGRTITGRVRETLVRGETVYQNGAIQVAGGYGQFIPRRATPGA